MGYILFHAKAKYQIQEKTTLLDSFWNNNNNDNNYSIFESMYYIYFYIDSVKI